MTVLTGIILAAAVFFIIIMAADCSRFIIKEYTCASKCLKKDITLVLLSDLHNKSFGKENKRLEAAIDGICPDAVLSAGDIYTAAKGEDNGQAALFVSRLAEKYPFYYGLGNHEHKTKLYPGEFGNIYEPFAKKIKQAGALILENEKVFLPVFNMDIYGLLLERDYYRKFKPLNMEKGYLEKTLGKPDSNHFSLLIAHNPEYFKEYAAWGADLVVSGHVHGGLMRLPFLGGVISPSLRLFPKYDGGLFKEKKSTMVLSRGLGTHTLPIRIFNPGELVVIHVKAGS